MFEDFFSRSPVYQQIAAEGFVKGIEQGKHQALQKERQTLIRCVELRFSGLVMLAQQQAEQIDDTEVLQQVLINLFTAQSADNAQEVLLAIPRKPQSHD